MSGARSGLGTWDGWAVAELRRSWDVPRLEAYGTIGSTNDRARELAEAGAEPWTTVLADQQTRGRGRRGATWVSKPGAGLWMSVLLESRRLARSTPLEVGLACAEAIESLLAGIEVGIKWPNDLVVGGAKVGGILCEVVGEAVVAGIGVNVAEAPDALDAAMGRSLPPGSLSDAGGRTVARHALAAAVLVRLRAVLGESLENDGEAFRGGAGAAPPGLAARTLEEVRRRDVLAGRLVETEQAGSGRGDGIDASGALRLLLADGSTARVASGSVRLSAAGGGDE